MPTEVLCRPAGCRQSDFFADRSLSAVGKAGYADCLWWLSAKRVFADRDIPSCRQSPGLSAKPRFPVVIAPYVPLRLSRRRQDGWLACQYHHDKAARDASESLFTRQPLSACRLETPTGARPSCLNSDKYKAVLRSLPLITTQRPNRVLDTRAKQNRKKMARCYFRLLPLALTRSNS